MKRIFAALVALFIAALAFAGPASAGGSNDPTPYTVNASGVTLPAGDTFPANGHVNIKYTVNGGPEKSAGIHFDPNNNQPGGAWIGESNIPWSGFGLSGDFCVTWVQVSMYNEHYGEGGQPPVCVTDKPNADNKKVTLCHATGSETNPYNKITISVKAFYQSGHIDDEGDIWESFTYTTVGKGTVTVPARGNTALLAFDDCVEPKVDEKIAKPTVKVVDKCENDKDDFSVPGGRGYTVGARTGTYPNWSIVVTADEGFVFNDGSKSVTYTTTAADFPNSDDCDLPETGGAAQYNVGLGALALAGIVGIGVLMFRVGRKRA